MPSYFENFPKIYYDAVGKGDYKLVTNLLRRVQIKEGLRETAALFDLYDICLLYTNPRPRDLSTARMACSG